MHSMIKGLLIVEKYAPDFETHCEHDKLLIYSDDKVEPDTISKEDVDKLEEYGIHVADEDDEESFYSFRWGSC